jgi:hypothetical protein
MLKRFLMGGFFILALAACQPQQQPTATPTAVVPTVTPTVAGEATATPTPAAPVARNTLPPPFTPTQSEPATPTVTETPPVTATFFDPVVTLPAGCETFLVSDASRSIRFNLGESPTVSWSGAAGAVRYRLKLVETTGRILDENIYIAETSYTFPAELFGRGRFYGWEVYPINEAGDQMCFIQGGELTPVVQPGQ